MYKAHAPTPAGRCMTVQPAIRLRTKHVFVYKFYGKLYEAPTQSYAILTACPFWAANIKASLPLVSCVAKRPPRRPHGGH